MIINPRIALAGLDEGRDVLCEVLEVAATHVTVMARGSGQWFEVELQHLVTGANGRQSASVFREVVPDPI